MKLIKNNNNITVKELAGYFGNKIYFGPFSGLKIPEEHLKILTLSEVLGFYESCLHNSISELLNRRIKNIMIIGGNNGYYSAGLSYLFNPDKLLIYEMTLSLHDTIKKWFETNNLSNFNLLGEATIDEFKGITDKIDLLLMDCEGFEKTLLNPSEFEWQKNADILVELHPFYSENLISDFTNKFSQTHFIELIYDDFNEDNKISSILNGIGKSVNYAKHPTHRWIKEGSKKVYTSGIFMFLKRKEI